MKRSTLLVISILLPAMLAAQGERVKPSGSPSAEAEIRSAEARRFQAMTASDVTALDSLLSADLVYTHASGWRQTKAEFLASIRSGEVKYHSISSHDVSIHVYGGTAVATGRAPVKVRGKGQELVMELVYLEVFVKQDGRWELAAWQSTRLTP
jgi:ketosteroid isomerase-like protein